jgi:membrane protein DedA with SNARE-associated domain
MIVELLTQLINLVISIVGEMGYLGIFIGMTIESSFFPFPSEAILLPAGVLVARQEMNFFIVLTLGILGSLLGALINFFLALYIGRSGVDFLISKYGKVVFLTKEKLEKSDIYFKKHGDITTFIGRLIPVIRQLISIPAGFSKMNLFKFVIFTSFGAGIWVAILIIAGMLFQNNISFIEENMMILSIIVMLFSGIVYISYLLINKRRKS